MAKKTGRPRKHSDWSVFKKSKIYTPTVEPEKLSNYIKRMKEDWDGTTLPDFALELWKYLKIHPFLTAEDLPEITGCTISQARYAFHHLQLRKLIVARKFWEVRPIPFPIDESLNNGLGRTLRWEDDEKKILHIPKAVRKRVKSALRDPNVHIPSELRSLIDAVPKRGGTYYGKSIGEEVDE